MTQKEALLVKYYETMNEVAKLNETCHRTNVEQMLETGELSNRARKCTVDSLQSDICRAENILASAKKQAARKAYLETEEGQAALEAIKKQLALQSEILKKEHDETNEKLQDLLAQVSSRLVVRDLANTHATIGLEGGHQFNEFTVYFGKQYGSDEPQFSINVGSTGSFDIDSERAEFYSLLGQFLSSPVKNDIRELLIGFNSCAEVFLDKFSQLRREENQLGL